MAVAKDHFTSFATVSTGTAKTIPSSTGNCLVVIFQASNAADAVTSVTDSAGNTYVRAGMPSVANLGAIDCWYAANAIAGVTTVTVNWSGGHTALAISVYDLSGTDPTNPLAAQAAFIQPQLVASTQAGPTVNLKDGGGIVIAAETDSSGTVSAIGAPFALDSNLSFSSTASTLNGSGGVFTPTWTATNGPWSGMTVAFKSTTGKALVVVSQISSGGLVLTIPATKLGNLLVVLVVTNGNATVTGIADNGAGGSDAYAQCLNARATGTPVQDFSTDIWYAKNIKAGVTQVTLTMSNSFTFGAVVMEIEGADVSTPFDLATHADNQTAGAVGPPFLMSNPSLTPSGQAILIGCEANANAILNPVTNDPFLAGTITGGVAGAWYPVGVVAAYHANWLSDTSGDTYCASLASFVPTRVAVGDQITEQLQYQLTIR